MEISKSENRPRPRIQTASPLMFESDDEFSDNESSLNCDKSANETISSFTEPTKEEKMLKNLQTILMGIPPPPAFTVPQLDSREILKLWREHQSYRVVLSPSKDKQSDAKNLEKQAKITSWPEVVAVDHWDIYYNQSSASEELARLSVRYKERFVGAETASCINALFLKSPSCTASARKRARTRAWGHSPGRRLSHLARRRKAFSSASLCSVAGNNNPDKKMIMVEIKKIGNRQKRNSAKKTKPTPKKKNDGNTNTHKRALFQSPDQQPSASDVKTPNTKNIQKSKRNLFTDSSEKKVNENGKRERAVPRRVSPRKRVNRTLSFQEGTQSRAPPQPQQNSNMQQQALTGAHKQKMLWAATNALRDEGMGMNHDLFRPCMSVLFKACQRLWLTRVSKQPLEGSTSENMLSLTKQFSTYTIKQINADPTSEHMALVCTNIIKMAEKRDTDSQPSTSRRSLMNLSEAKCVKNQNAVNRTPAKTPVKNTPKSQEKLRRSARKCVLNDSVKENCDKKKEPVASFLDAADLKKTPVKNISQDRLRPVRKCALFSDVSSVTCDSSTSVNPVPIGPKQTPRKDTPEKSNKTPQEGLRRSARKCLLYNESPKLYCDNGRESPYVKLVGTPDKTATEDKPRRSARKCFLFEDLTDTVCESGNPETPTINQSKRTPSKNTPQEKLRRSARKCSLFNDSSKSICDNNKQLASVVHSEANLEKPTQAKVTFKEDKHNESSGSIPNLEVNLCKQNPSTVSIQSSPEKSFRVTRRVSCDMVKNASLNDAVSKKSSQKSKKSPTQNKISVCQIEPPSITTRSSSTSKAVVEPNFQLTSSKVTEKIHSISSSIKPSSLGTTVKLFGNEVIKTNQVSKITARRSSTKCVQKSHEPAKSSLLSSEFDGCTSSDATSTDRITKVGGFFETNKENLGNPRLKNNFDEKSQKGTISSQRCLQAVGNTPLPQLVNGPVNMTLQLYKLSNSTGEIVGNEGFVPTEPPKLVPHWLQDYDSKETSDKKHSPPTLVPHWEGTGSTNSSLPESIMPHWQQLSNNATTSDKIMFDFDNTSYEINFPEASEDDTRASSICAPFDFPHLVDDSKSCFNSVFRKFDTGSYPN